MKNFNEFLVRVNESYVNDYYLQLMLAYKKFMFLFGNNSVMYYNNQSNDDKPINKYLNDDRKTRFPYSSIPEHIEKVSLFNKMIFVNQILDFEKAYISINDGFITKMTTFKDNEGAIVHNKVLCINNLTKNATIVSRTELESYLKTGSLSSKDEKEYIKLYIVSNKYACFLKNELESEQKLISDEKNRLIDLIALKFKNDTRRELIKAVLRLDVIEPFVVCEELMVKITPTGDIQLEIFNIKYLGRDRYELSISPIPVTKESLDVIKANAMLPKINLTRNPKINLHLNSNITLEQANKEKKLFLNRK